MRSRTVAVCSLVALVLVAGCSTSSVGVILGDPSGLAVRGMLESDKTLNFAIGIAGRDSDLAYGHIDYAMYPNRVRREDWNPYIGIGVGYLAVLNDEGRNDHVGASLRVPLGLSYDSRGWDFFVQFAPYLGEFSGVTLALGLRLAL